MTRQDQDQLGKQYLAELLKLLGEVKTSKDVPSFTGHIDGYFVPDKTKKTEIPLELLSKIAAESCLIQVFRNAPSLVEIRNCKGKLYLIHGELLRSARREKKSLTEAELPLLWILTPTLSQSMKTSLGFKQKKEWGEGVYFQPEAEKVALVAIHQLPETTQETLWLRVLGKGGTQKRAIAELLKLKGYLPWVDNVLEILANWRVNVDMAQNIDSREKEELMMNLSPAYESWLEETLSKGRAEGLSEGRVEGKVEGLREGTMNLVQNLLAVKFGGVDEQLEKVINPMLNLPAEELSRLILTLNREELLTRFSDGNPDEVRDN